MKYQLKHFLFHLAGESEGRQSSPDGAPIFLQVPTTWFPSRKGPRPSFLRCSMITPPPRGNRCPSEVAADSARSAQLGDPRPTSRSNSKRPESRVWPILGFSALRVVVIQNISSSRLRETVREKTCRGRLPGNMGLTKNVFISTYPPTACLLSRRPKVTHGSNVIPTETTTPKQAKSMAGRPRGPFGIDAAPPALPRHSGSQPLASSPSSKGPDRAKSEVGVSQTHEGMAGVSALRQTQTMSGVVLQPGPQGPVRQQVSGRREGLKACLPVLRSRSPSPPDTKVLFLVRTTMASVLGRGVSDEEEGGRGHGLRVFLMQLRRDADIGRGGSDSPFRGFSSTDPRDTEPRPGPEVESLATSITSACRFLHDWMGLALTFMRDSRLEFREASKMWPATKRCPEATRKRSLGGRSP